jgi:hypothetical protein
MPESYDSVLEHLQKTNTEYFDFEHEHRTLSSLVISGVSQGTSRQGRAIWKIFKFRGGGVSKLIEFNGQFLAKSPKFC